MQYIGMSMVEAYSTTKEIFSEEETQIEEGYNVVVSKDSEEHQFVPKHVFDELFKPIDALPFSLALEALKRGEKIARKGWNGKNMFLFYLPGSSVPKEYIKDPFLKDVVSTLDPNSDTFEALPSIRMRTADGKILTGWLASQTDMFAEDWYVI